MKRRDVIKNLSVLPITGVLSGNSYSFDSVEGSHETYSAASAAKRKLFKELGIRTFINAAGTYTAMSGCIMEDDVLEAIRFNFRRICHD